MRFTATFRPTFQVAFDHDVRERGHDRHLPELLNDRRNAAVRAETDLAERVREVIERELGHVVSMEVVQVESE